MSAVNIEIGRFFFLSVLPFTNKLSNVILSPLIFLLCLLYFPSILYFPILPPSLTRRPRTGSAQPRRAIRLGHKLALTLDFTADLEPDLESDSEPDFTPDLEPDCADSTRRPQDTLGCRHAIARLRSTGLLSFDVVNCAFTSSYIGHGFGSGRHQAAPNDRTAGSPEGEVGEYRRGLPSDLPILADSS